MGTVIVDLPKISMARAAQVCGLTRAEFLLELSAGEWTSSVSTWTS
jgi:hypothetical protein